MGKTMDQNKIKQYYESFQSPGNTTEINRLLSDEYGLFRDALEKEFEGEGVRALVLGSATTRNIGSVQRFISNDIKIAQEESVIFIIDNQTLSLHPHKEYADNDTRMPRVHVVGGDITRQPFEEKSFDIILSDYTAAFLPTEEDYQKFFEQIAHSLSDDGRAILAFFVCRDKGISSVLRNDEPDVGRSCISYPILLEMFEDSGLAIEAQHYRQAQRVYEGHKSEVATLVLRRVKIY
jgi:SAM-dependent methyltransferase